jgi:hypothetical protein
MPSEGVDRLSLVERNKDLARWFRDLRNRAEIGQVTPPPSIVDMIERLMEETAAEQLAEAVSDRDKLADHLARALAYAEAHPHVPVAWAVQAKADLAAIRGQ